MAIGALVVAAIFVVAIIVMVKNFDHQSNYEQEKRLRNILDYGERDSFYKTQSNDTSTQK